MFSPGDARVGRGRRADAARAGLTAKSRRLRYSVGMTLTEDIQHAIGKVPADPWAPAYDGDGQVRKGAWVADVTGLLDLEDWPAARILIGSRASLRRWCIAAQAR